MIILPFNALRPEQSLTSKIAALPYDVYDRKQAKAMVKQNQLSFLQIDRGETLFDQEVDIYGQEVYQAAKTKLEEMIQAGQFVKDEARSFYIYQLEGYGQSMTGIVCLTSCKDYEQNIIKRHEKTREVKERDRVNHINRLSAHTGPVFLMYQHNLDVEQVLEQADRELIFDFTADDGVRHRGYRIAPAADTERLQQVFGKIETAYIADGHHRAAAACKVAEIRRHEEESDYFLSVLFPDNQLQILDYNRVIRDLNGLTKDQLLDRLKQDFEVQPMTSYQPPVQKGQYNMFLEGEWYRLSFTGSIDGNIVSQLDVSILQDYLLGPILGIQDPRLDQRIDFVGGIKGHQELERRVQSDMAVGFALKPTLISELMEVSNQGLLMPPKSTWFEPKLRSGLFIHQISEA